MKLLIKDTFKKENNERSNLFVGKNVNDEWIGDTVEIDERIVKSFCDTFKENGYDVKRTLCAISELISLEKEISLINLEESQFKDIAAYIIYDEDKNRLELYCDMIDSFYLYKGKAWTYRPELFSFIDLSKFKNESLQVEIKNKLCSFLVKCNNEQAARSIVEESKLRKRTYNIRVETYADENEIRRAIDRVNSVYSSVEGLGDTLVCIEDEEMF